MAIGKARKTKEKDPNKLGLGRLLLWKSSDVAAGWATMPTMSYLSIYATNTLGLDVTVVGTILLASKIIDGAVDLFYGWLVDNTNTKLGRGRTYELCIVGMTLCTILQFSARADWSEGFKYVWLFITYLFTFSIFQSLRGAGGTPYTIRAFSNNQIVIRKLASYGGIVTTAGGMVMSIAFPILMQTLATSDTGWTAAVAIMMVPATLFSVLRFFFFKEDPSIDAASVQEKVDLKEIFTLFRRNKYVWLFAIIMLSYNILTSLSVATYFFTYVIGNVGVMSVTSLFSIVLLPLMLTFPALMKKLGGMCKMIAIFCCISIVGYVIVFASGTFLPGIFVGGFIGGFATLPLAYYGVLFLMDICTYNEILGMPRMEGSSSILSNFASNFGGSLGSWIVGILLGAAGFVSSTEEVVQPDSAVLMIRFLYSMLPAMLLVVILACILVFAKLENKIIPEWQAKKAAEAEALAAETGQAVTAAAAAPEAASEAQQGESLAAATN